MAEPHIIVWLAMTDHSFSIIVKLTTHTLNKHVLMSSDHDRELSDLSDENQITIFNSKLVT